MKLVEFEDGWYIVDEANDEEFGPYLTVAAAEAAYKELIRHVIGCPTCGDDNG